MTTAARRAWWIAAALGIAAAICLAPACVGTARAQAANQLDLSGAVQLDEVDNTVRTHLEQARAYAENHQWDEAVETYRLLMENYGGKVIAVSPRRYVRLADYCHLQIASLPAAALEIYRKPVDAVAERWYADGLAHRDPALLARVVSDMYCSAWGDDALLALGDIALERGEASIARSYWEQIIERPPEWIPQAAFDAAVKPAENAAAGNAAAGNAAADNVPAGNAPAAKAPADVDPLDRTAVLEWYQADESTRRAGYRLRHERRLGDDEAQRLIRFWKAARLPTAHLAYPRTALNPADVRARLVLASILEGSLTRAKGELEAFEQLHPGAEGNLAGKHEPYAKALARLLTEAQSWPSERTSEDWPTFAGNPARNKIARDAIDVGAPLWPAIPLGEPLTADATNVQRFGSYRVAERSDGLLSYHPLVVGDMVLVSTGRQIFAFNLQTGKPVWPGSPQKPAGEIYREGGPNGSLDRPTRGLGVPRFTMTVYENRL
ncbi:MAG TPA: tetratricopeptide repeat protein, partial [Pirellulales bacterium]